MLLASRWRENVRPYKKGTGSQLSFRLPQLHRFVSPATHAVTTRRGRKRQRRAQAADLLQHSNPAATDPQRAGAAAESAEPRGEAPAAERKGRGGGAVKAEGCAAAESPRGEASEGSRPGTQQLPEAGGETIAEPAPPSGDAAAAVSERITRSGYKDRSAKRKGDSSSAADDVVAQEDAGQPAYDGMDEDAQLVFKLADTLDIAEDVVARAVQRYQRLVSNDLT